MRRLWLVALLPLFAAACGGKKESGPTALPPVPVTVQTVAPRDVPVSKDFVGQVASSRQVQIVARVNGFLEKRHYEEGAMVRAGQVMFQMDAKPFQAQLDAALAALDEQKARLVVANDNLARVKPLAALNALSQKELDDAIGQQKAAAAAVEVAKANVDTAQLNLSYTTITSPLAGLSSYARVQDGQYVNVADSLLTYVSQLDPIWINFSLSESELLATRAAEQAGQLRAPELRQFTVEAILGDGSLFPHKGRITFADADFSQQTGTYLLRATLPNPQGLLRPGMFVTVRVAGAVRPNAILVPQKAVLQGAQGHFVIVVKDGTAQIRPVQVGPWHGDQWFITHGLSAGDVVVTDGVAKLSPGAAVQVVAQAEDKAPAPAAAPAAAGAKK